MEKKVHNIPEKVLIDHYDLQVILFLVKQLGAFCSTCGKEFKFNLSTLQHENLGHVHCTEQGRSRISCWGAPTLIGGGTNLQHRCFLVKTYVKMKEFCPVGGGATCQKLLYVDPPLQSVMCSIIVAKSAININSCLK